MVSRGGDTVSAVALSPVAAETFNGFANPKAPRTMARNIWVAEDDGDLKKLDVANGAVLQIKGMSADITAFQIAFDGVNIWVPTVGGIQVVCVKTRWVTRWRTPL